jgi:predicted transcriptional regulator
MALGDLERGVMDLLWRSPAGATAYELQDALAADGRQLAATTLLTVLSRLEKKGFAVADRSARPHRYTAAAERAAHVAELMRDALGEADDRQAVLERFVGSVSPDDAATLRRILQGGAAR